MCSHRVWLCAEHMRQQPVLPPELDSMLFEYLNRILPACHELVNHVMHHPRNISNLSPTWPLGLSLEKYITDAIALLTYGVLCLPFDIFFPTNEVIHGS